MVDPGAFRHSRFERIPVETEALRSVIQNDEIPETGKVSANATTPSCTARTPVASAARISMPLDELPAAAIVPAEFGRGWAVHRPVEAAAKRLERQRHVGHAAGVAQRELQFLLRRLQFPGKLSVQVATTIDVAASARPVPARRGPMQSVLSRPRLARRQHPSDGSRAFGVRVSGRRMSTDAVRCARGPVSPARRPFATPGRRGASRAPPGARARNALSPSCTFRRVAHSTPGAVSCRSLPVLRSWYSLLECRPECRLRHGRPVSALRRGSAAPLRACGGYSAGAFVVASPIRLALECHQPLASPFGHRFGTGAVRNLSGGDDEERRGRENAEVRKATVIVRLSRRTRRARRS